MQASRSSANIDTLVEAQQKTKNAHKPPFTLICRKLKLTIQIDQKTLFQEKRRGHFLKSPQLQ